MFLAHAGSKHVSLNSFRKRPVYGEVPHSFLCKGRGWGTKIDVPRCPRETDDGRSGKITRNNSFPRTSASLSLYKMTEVEGDQYRVECVF